MKVKILFCHKRIEFTKEEQFFFHGCVCAYKQLLIPSGIQSSCYSSMHISLTNTESTDCDVWRITWHYKAVFLRLLLFFKDDFFVPQGTSLLRRLTLKALIWQVPWGRSGGGSGSQRLARWTTGLCRNDRVVKWWLLLLHLQSCNYSDQIGSFLFPRFQNYLTSR